MIKSKLKLSNPNSKLKKYQGLYIFSLPAGYSCPTAKLCKSQADRDTGRVSDGKDTVFRCFAASTEAYSGNYRKMVWHNFDELKKVQKSQEKMAALLEDSIPTTAKYLRMHGGGDFFNEAYLRAWMDVAGTRPNCLFYGYTKQTGLFLKYQDKFPQNFRLTVSEGGTQDYMLDGLQVPTVSVVNHPDDAEEQKIAIDHDDSHAMEGNHSFAVLLHGTQPAGSTSAAALKRMRTEKIKFGYGKKKAKNGKS